MMILADSDFEHSSEMWPLVGGVVLLLVAGLCIAVLLVMRGRRAAQSRVDHDLPGPCGQEPQSPVAPETCPLASSTDAEAQEEDYDFDGRILAMLDQKGRPMLQSEIATNLHLRESDLATWIASMEQRGMIHRRWDQTRSSYVVQPTAGGRI